MEPFNIHILGCGSALPTLRHNASSQVVEMRGKMFMIDCGEGTQIQLRRSKIHFSRVQCVFISHLHGDHCLGLIGMISTFGLLGRTAPLHVYAPGALEQMLRAQMDMFCSGLEYEVLFHAVNTAACQVVYEDRGLTVESIPLSHRVPCCGYLFREKMGKRHIRRDMIDFYHIPISQMDNIRSGMGWTTDEGVMVPNERLTTPPDPPRSYAYCSDTKYMPELHERLSGVNLLYHEATYGQDCADRARLYNHSTAAQAAMVAKNAQVGKLLLGHFSARYEDENMLLEEARKIFEATELADEGRVFSVK